MPEFLEQVAALSPLGVQAVEKMNAQSDHIRRLEVGSNAAKQHHARLIEAERLKTADAERRLRDQTREFTRLKSDDRTLTKAARRSGMFEDAPSGEAP
jgi:hypothetical protein